MSSHSVVVALFRGYVHGGMPDWVMYAFFGTFGVVGLIGWFDDRREKRANKKSAAQRVK
jgi:UDP-N-acetylmuramyl pentapeptide phosphotransferase/UDP-N-acetylglucosamine-1-phosphate transferase